MNLRSLSILVVSVSVAGSLFAADPFAGTWKENFGQSKRKASDDAKERFLIIEERGTDLYFTRRDVSSHGKSKDYVQSAPAKGGLVATRAGFTAPPADRPFTVKRIDARTLDEIQSDGKQVFSAQHFTLSADGKVLTIQVKDSTGDRVAVYERQ